LKALSTPTSSILESSSRNFSTSSFLVEGKSLKLTRGSSLIIWATTWGKLDNHNLLNI